MSFIDVISDNSNKKLFKVPSHVLEMYNLKMLYLEGNFITRLPENFFERLSKLTWLDLRNNQLQQLPTSIAYHTYLETLLLQNNQIEEIPNEVGLVPNLKVLQVSGNPLKYPELKIIEGGTESLLFHLKQQYYKTNPDAEDVDEEETQIIPMGTLGVARIKKPKKMTVQQLLRETAKRCVTPTSKEPVIQVTSLSTADSNESNTTKVKTTHPTRKISKTTKSCSKVSLRSQTSSWNAKKKSSSYKSINEETLKEVWLKKLSEILSNQEKILQQEKNLRALSKWRTKKKMEAPKSSLDRILEAPFATDKNEKMLNRQDLSKQIDEMIKQSKKTTKKSKKIDIQQLINDVVEQMKNMETKNSESKMSDPKDKHIVSEQINNIIELHKKIIALQVANDHT